MSFDPNAPVFIPPDVNEDQATHPGGTFGNDGESELIRCQYNWRYEKEDHAFDAFGSEPPKDAIPWVNLGVRTNHPDVGPVNVYTSPFGDHPTALRSKGGKGNIAMAVMTNLQLAGMAPGSWPDLVGRKVVVETKQRTYKGKVYADIVAIWLK